MGDNEYLVLDDNRCVCFTREQPIGVVELTVAGHGTVYVLSTERCVLLDSGLVCVLVTCWQPSGGQILLCSNR